MKIELEVDIPEGYEATGEYRYPRYGECYLNAYGLPIEHHTWTIPHMVIILHKKLLTGKAWVDTLPEGTVFLYKERAHQKLGAAGDVSRVAYGRVAACSEWSDETCRILWKP